MMMMVTIVTMAVMMVMLDGYKIHLTKADALLRHDLLRELTHT